MRYNLILCSIVTLIFSVFLTVVPAFASVEVGVDVPPNPSDKYYDSRCEYVYGSTIEYGGRYFGSYVACNIEPSYYGTFIANAVPNGSSWLMRSYAFVDVTNRSDYLFQLYVYSVYQNSSMNLIGWGEVRDSSYDYNHFLTVDDRTYLVVVSNPSLPDTFNVSNVTNYYNDNIEYLDDEYWTSLTDRDIFDKCVNFDHPAIIGEYDASIPCLVRADVSFSNVTVRETVDNNGDIVPLTQAGQIAGIVSPFTNKGFLTSEYAVDYKVFFGMTTCKTVPVNEVVNTESFTLTKYNGGLSLDIFNQASVDWVADNYSVGKFRENPGRKRVSCNVIVVNARLRRKSDGAYGDWYTIGVNNLGYNDNSYHIDYNGYYKPLSQGYSGITSGTNDNPMGEFDDSLTSQYNPSTSITANDVSLGTSENGGVLQQGGVLDLITANGDTNYDNILDALGDVPQLFGVVFGFFPPYVLAFIGTAFILLVSIGIVKILI